MEEQDKRIKHENESNQEGSNTNNEKINTIKDINDNLSSKHSEEQPQQNHPEESEQLPKQEEQHSQNIQSEYPIGESNNKLNDITKPLDQKNTESKTPKSKKPLMFGIIAILIIVFALVIIYPHAPKRTNSQNTTVPTTIYFIPTTLINSCGTLNHPGTYNLSSNVTYTKFNGSCITIDTNNVAVFCKNYSIIGSGPFAVSSNTTSAILINGATNVSIKGCQISKFSYGVKSYNSHYVNISNSNVSYNIVSNIYLNNTKHSNINNDTLQGTKTNSSSLRITNNSLYNNITNNKLNGNYWGIHINSKFNNYKNNRFGNTNISFSCSLKSGLYGTSNANLNTCLTNIGCSFLSCSVENIQANVSKIVLSKQISSCGSITSPGNYHLTSNINAAYVNPPGTIWQHNLACINIKSTDVNLYCNNHTISNATTAISVIGQKNVNITDCRVNNATYVGINISNSDGLTISNAVITNAKYGIYLSNSSVNQFTGFRVQNNVMGIYLNKSFSNSFLKGYARNNSLIDIYAANDSLGPLSNILLKTTCGVSDAAWARCDHYMDSNLLFFGLTSCTPLTLSGNYLLQNNILNTQINCFPIKADNVTLNCNGKIMTNKYNGYAASSGVYVHNRKNVTIKNCVTDNFDTGINVSNSTKVKLLNNSPGGPQQIVGIFLINSDFSLLIQNKIISAVTDIYLSNVILSTIINNTVSYAKHNGYGIYLLNSKDNMILNNNGTNNYIGIYISGNSQNNTVYKNSLVTSTYADYICTANNSGIYSEFGNINYGKKKVNCRWLVAISHGQRIQSEALQNPSTLIIPSDNVYGDGATTFSVYSNSTSINCENHTIISTKGGTFASFINAQHTSIKNCNLIGFTTPIKVTNSSTDIYNNTIYGGFSGGNSNNKTNEISVSYSNGPTIRNNNLFGDFNGMYLLNDSNGALQNNNVKTGLISYSIINSYLMQIFNNWGDSVSNGGWIFDNSTQNQVNNNNFYGNLFGVECKGSSKNSNSNPNAGNNYSSNKNCGWIKN